MKSLFLTFILCAISTLLPAQNWDINTLKAINGWDGKLMRHTSKGLSNSTPYLVAGIPSAMAIYGLITKDSKLTRNGIYIGSTVIEATAITYGLKHLVGRTRPYDKHPDKINCYGKESSPSFPSSHTAAAFSLATSLSITYPKWYVIAPSAVWASAVGFARMNQGVHYPSDIIGGAAIGIGCGFLNVYVNRWFWKLVK